MRIVAKTDIGRVRESNQDSYAAGELPGGVAWAVVCDGMGGAAGGSVASSTYTGYRKTNVNGRTHTGIEQVTLQEDLSVCDGDNVGRNVCRYISCLCLNDRKCCDRTSACFFT